LTQRQIGLRIDVDTLRGTRDGVPRLLEYLNRAGVKGTFFFSVGPDNMGRHLYRLLKPRFFIKMLRSRAASLYGWDILLRGTFWPGPLIGKRLKHVIRATAEAGHEIGFHAWDHHHWQSRIDTLSEAQIRDIVEKGIDLLTAATGEPPVCFASPGWRANNFSVKVLETFQFTYSSDCRGTSIFYPNVDGVPLKTPQVPVTLPTYDELVGRDGVTQKDFNTILLDKLRADQLNVLTIHAEVEGGVCLPLFEQFVSKATDMGYHFVPLGRLPECHQPIPTGNIIAGTIPGREGWVALQSDTGT